MPRIQLPESRATIQDQVPGADLQTRSVGATGNSIADLGHAIQGFGAELLQKRTQAQTADYAFSNEQLDKQAIKEYGDNLKLNTPPGTNDYSTKMETFIKDRSNLNQQNAPTEQARLAYQSKTEALHTSAMIEASAYENKRNAESYIENINKGIDLNQRLFLDNPDPTKYKETVDGIKQQIDSQTGAGKLFDENVGAGKKVQVEQQLSMSILKGLANQGHYDVALKLLDSKNGESDVAKGLTGEQKAAFQSQLIGLQQNKSETNKELINKNIKDFQYTAMNNGVVDQAQLSKILSGINSNQSFKPEDRSRITDTLKTVVLASGELQKLNTMTNEQLMNYKPKIDTKSTFNVAARGDIASHLENYRDQILKQRSTDPMQVIQDANPQLKSLAIQSQGTDPNASKDYLDQALASQAQMGVTQPRVTTKQEASFAASQLQSAPSAAGADIILQKLKSQYGEYLPKALDEMAKDSHGITHDYVIASYLPNQQSRVMAIDNVLKQKDINKNFTDSFHSPPDLKTPIAQVSSDLRQAIIQRTNSAADVGAYNAFTKQVELESKKTLALNPNISASKAVNQAYDNIISKNFEMIPAVRSTIMMPKQADGVYNDPKIVESFVQQNSDQNALKNLDVIVPKSFPKADDWYNLVATKSRWVTNSSLSGIQLVYDSPTSGRTLPLTDSKGRAIEKSFKDIMINAPQIKQQDYNFQKIELQKQNQEGMLGKF